MVVSRVIIDPPALGAWNMAVDEALLDDSAENGVATLRFYQWSEPTLSLGYFQRYDDRNRHAPSQVCAAVRRQTGGGAILHDRELTYSLTLPASHPLAHRTEELYMAVHDAFIEVIMPLIAKSQPSRNLMQFDQASSLPPRAEPFLCFQRRARGDVLLLPPERPVAITGPIPPPGSKILGSAQRRHRGALLQHGSLLLVKSPAAPEIAGLRDLTGGNVDTDDLTTSLTDKLGKALGVKLLRAELPAGLESKAKELANNKYNSAAWTKRR